MSLQDTVTKQYVSDPKVFADAFNYLIYDGEQVIRPEQLTDLDATQFAIPYREEEEGKPESTQKYRDVLKTLAVKTDDQRSVPFQFRKPMIFLQQPLHLLLIVLILNIGKNFAQAAVQTP